MPKIALANHTREKSQQHNGGYIPLRSWRQFIKGFVLFSSNEHPSGNKQMANISESAKIAIGRNTFFIMDMAYVNFFHTLFQRKLQRSKAASVVDSFPAAFGDK